jgi:hypothetical protein
MKPFYFLQACLYWLQAYFLSSLARAVIKRGVSRAQAIAHRADRLVEADPDNPGHLEFQRQAREALGRMRTSRASIEIQHGRIKSG